MIVIFGTETQNKNGLSWKGLLKITKSNLFAMGGHVNFAICLQYFKSHYYLAFMWTLPAIKLLLNQF